MFCDYASSFHPFFLLFVHLRTHLLRHSPSPFVLVFLSKPPTAWHFFFFSTLSFIFAVICYLVFGVVSRKSQSHRHRAANETLGYARQWWWPSFISSSCQSIFRPISENLFLLALNRAASAVSDSVTTWPFTTCNDILSVDYNSQRQPFPLG